MNHYAAEQLTRQRHDQFAQEARGDHLMRAASEATVVGSPMRAVGGLINAVRERLSRIVPRLRSGIRMKTIG